MGIAFKNNNNNKTKQNTRSLYVAQAGLKPPILLPSLPTPPPCWGSRWAPPSQAASPFTPITVTLPVKMHLSTALPRTHWFYRWLAGTDTSLQRATAGKRHVICCSGGWSMASCFQIRFQNQRVRNPNPACSCPSWREASIGWGMCTNCPVWSKHPCAVRSHTDSQPIRFRPEMKIAITLLLLHSVKVDF